MSHRRRDTVTVSPPTLDRTAFAQTDAALPGPHSPFDRAWLLARFDEGLQVRLLKPPREGVVMFQPGRLAWRPVEGAAHAVVVHDLRAGPGALACENTARLWSEAEQFARYYGYAMVLALLGDGPGLVAADRAPGRGWVTVDRGAGGVRLVARILHGPVALPRLPSDWGLRAAALGPGLVIQTTGESRRLERLASARVAALRRRGIAARHLRPCDSEAARSGAIRPAAAYAVACDGRLLGGPEVSMAEMLRLSAAADVSAHSPS
jgi:hypothetical protein